MVLIVQAIVLSIIQGITEWLPISSSGHLAIFEQMFGLKEFSFAVFLHFASILAVIIIFWKDIMKILNFKKPENLRYIGLIIIAIIPAGIFGFLIKDKIDEIFSNLLFIGIFFIIGGILIFSTKFFKEKRGNIGVTDSILIGLFQVLGIFPGVSRSGACISGGIFRNIKKSEIIKFSFLVAIPVIFGATFLEAKDLIVSNITWNIVIVSFIITFLTSIFAIKVLMKIIQGGRFYLFGIYNLVLGIGIIIWKIVF
jgi:undecaprenyl-diphosphatase